MLIELVRKNRSYRRFYQQKTIPFESLVEMIGLARLSPSAANLQPLKFVAVNNADLNAEIFSTLAWAGYLRDWPGPVEGERPAAYIIILGDDRIKKNIDCDHGIAAQSILLGAVEKGLGGCIIASIEHKRLSKILGIPEYLQIKLVIALGEPLESVEIESVKEDGSIEYWRDENQGHHVPKRSIQEIMISLKRKQQGDE